MRGGFAEGWCVEWATPRTARIGCANGGDRNKPWRENLLHRRIGEHPELAFAFDAIGFEVGVIHGEDRGERFPLCQVNQSSVGEIHRAIRVSRH